MEPIKKIILSTVTLFSTAACGMMSHHMAQGDPDKMFIMQAAMASNAEIQTSQLALQRSKMSDVRSFASMMIAGHEMANRELAPIAMAQGLSLPTEADPTHMMAADHLAKVPADKFDSEYVAQMVGDHEMVVSKFEHVSKNASNAAVRNYASMELPGLRHHLEVAKGLEEKLSK